MEKQRHKQGSEEGLHLRLLARDQQQLTDGPGDLESGRGGGGARGGGESTGAGESTMPSSLLSVIAPSIWIGLPSAVTGVASE